MASEDRYNKKLERRLCELEQRKESFIQLIMDVRKKLHKDEYRKRRNTCDGFQD